MEPDGPPNQSVPPGSAVRKPALPALTGLRTILAINVMFFHFTPNHPDFLSPLLNNAYVFVGFFFLLSGFVLAYNYADRPTLSKRRFLLARFSRIYPTYALVLLLSIPFLVIAERPARSPGEFLAGLALTPLTLQSWSPSLATFWNTVAWTVPAEFFLYLLFPFLLLFLQRHGHRLASPRSLIAAIVLVWLLGLVPHTTYLLLNPDHLQEPATRYTYAFWLRALKYSPPPYLGIFTAGILLARLHGTWALSPRTRTWMALVALSGLVLFFAIGVERLPYVLIHGCLLLPLFATLTLGLAGTNAVASIFAVRPLVKIGETTFALYLVHFNGFLLLHYWHVPEHLRLAWLDPWLSYALLIGLAWLVSRFYEAPARRFVLGLFEAPTKP